MTDSQLTYTLPLLTDHHSHPLLYASFLKAVDLSPVTTPAAAYERLAAADASPMIVGYGWKDNFFSFDERQLESLPALAIFNLSLHKLLLNQAGRDYLVQVHGEQVHHIDNHEWFEAHLCQVWNWFALLNGSPQALVDFYQQLEKLGVWSADEMLLVAEREIEWFETAGLIDRTRFWAGPETYPQLSPAAQAKVHGIKLFTDGAFGARTAAISVPYADDPIQQNRGMLMYSDESLRQVVAQAAEIGKSLAVHAIGDRAIEQVIATFEACGSRLSRFQEIRIEHAQLISREQAQRAKRMGVKLSMQPNFTIDSTDYQDRLSPTFLAGNNPFRMLIDEVGFEPGADLLFGSDGMPHGTAYALQQSLFPPFASQKLTIDEFRSGYCRRETQRQQQVLVDQAAGQVTLLEQSVSH